MTAITAWSYSRVELYERCPLAFKLRHIDKVPEEPSPAMERGNRVHADLAAHILGQGPIPAEGAKMAGMLGELAALPMAMKSVEQEWGFDRHWNPTGWFGKDTWLRVKLDACVVYPDGTADVIDHKTGKKYATNNDQMELFALAVFRKFPDVVQATTRLWYVDSGDEVAKDFVVVDADYLMARWEQRIEPMFADTVFAPRPNDKCRFCSYAKGKGGPCKFG